MRTGSQIASNLPIGSNDAETASREAAIWSAIKNHEVPSWVGNLFIPIRIDAADKGGKQHKLTLYVAPRYFEVGSDADPFLTPLWPITAQDTANLVGAILPSQKIVDYIWQFADKRLPIGPPRGFTIPGADMERTPSWIAHSNIVQKQYAGSHNIIAGGKKDLVVGPGLTGTQVAIYSTPFPGEGTALRAYGPLMDDPWHPGQKARVPLHQPYSTIHHSKYSDYSHGLRLISRKAELDGTLVDIDQLFLDPVLHTLVSDQGPFLPYFPNVGSAPVIASKYGIEVTPETIAPDSSPSVDPVDPVDPVSPMGNKEKAGLIVGGLIGLGASVVLSFGILGTVAATTAGALIGRSRG